MAGDLTAKHMLVGNKLRPRVKCFMLGYTRMTASLMTVL